MSFEAILQEGAFNASQRTQLNTMLEELYANNVGASEAFLATAVGETELLPATETARVVTITALVTVTFANNAGAQPTFEVGITSNPDEAFATSALTNATAGTVVQRVINVPAGEAVIVTAVAATVDGAGAVTIGAVGTLAA